MKTASYVLPFLLMFASGCSTELVDRPAAQPQGAKVDGRNVSNAAVTAAAPAACFIRGASRTLAPRARVRSGIELVSTSKRLALGFTTTPNEAVAIDLDLSSVEASQTLSRHSSDPIRRITPLVLGDESIGAAVDAECKANRLESSRTVSGDSPFVIGVADGHLAWAPCPAQTPQPIWQLPAGAIQDLQGVALGENGGFVVLFRQGNSLWVGRLDSKKEPVGPLSKIAERSQLRWPTVAESSGNVLVMWTEQAEGGEKWSLAGAKLTTGAAAPIQIDTAAGGLGGDAIQPSLAAIDGGRFLLVWTEGTVSTRQIRAATLDSSGATIGSALTVSSGIDAAWGRAAVTADGRGAVVFFASTAGGFAILATPIACSVAPSSKAPAIVASRP